MLDRIPSWAPGVLVSLVVFPVAGLIAFQQHSKDFESELRKEVTRLEKTGSDQELRIRKLEVSTGKMYQTILHLDKTVTANGRKLDQILNKFSTLAKK